MLTMPEVGSSYVLVDFHSFAVHSISMEMVVKSLIFSFESRQIQAWAECHIIKHLHVHVQCTNLPTCM